MLRDGGKLDSKSVCMHRVGRGFTRLTSLAKAEGFSDRTNGYVSMN